MIKHGNLSIEIEDVLQIININKRRKSPSLCVVNRSFNLSSFTSQKVILALYYKGFMEKPNTLFPFKEWVVGSNPTGRTLDLYPIKWTPIECCTYLMDLVFVCLFDSSHPYGRVSIDFKDQKH